LNAIKEVWLTKGCRMFKRSTLTVGAKNGVHLLA
jgi:hypothetical protein